MVIFAVTSFLNGPIPVSTISATETYGKCAIPASKQSCKEYSRVYNVLNGLAGGTLKVFESKEAPPGCHVNRTTYKVAWNEEKESDITPWIAICTYPPSGMDRFKKICIE